MPMTVDQIVDDALSLPRHSRAFIARLLLDTLEADGSAEQIDAAWVALAKERDAEMTAHPDVCRTHEQVMRAASEALRCMR